MELERDRWTTLFIKPTDYLERLSGVRTLYYHTVGGLDDTLEKFIHITKDDRFPFEQLIAGNVYVVKAMYRQNQIYFVNVWDVQVVGVISA